MDESPRSFEPARLLRWAEEEAPLVRLETTRDALPRGLAAAMAPCLIDHERSEPEGDDGYWIVRNVNALGCPVAGRTVLCTARIPTRGVVRAEWVLVILKKLGLDTPAGHAQLRLLFDPHRRPRLLGRGLEDLCDDPYLDELVFSWEAWRPPTEDFDPVKGLDPKAFLLTTRCFDGGQRFLEDSLRHRHWRGYELALPGGPRSLDALLRTCLTVGDSQGRHAITWAIDQELELGELDEAQSAAWQALHERILASDVPADPVAEMVSETVSYQLLERSCITMALTAIDLTVRRVANRDDGKAPPRLQITPRDLPGWMDDLAHGDRRTLLRLLPSALWWLARHQDVLPGETFKLLERANLLAVKDGRTVVREYDIDDETPWGPLSGKIMF